MTSCRRALTYISRTPTWLPKKTCISEIMKSWAGWLKANQAGQHSWIESRWAQIKPESPEGAANKLLVFVVGLPPLHTSCSFPITKLTSASLLSCERWDSLTVRATSENQSFALLPTAQTLGLVILSKWFSQSFNNNNLMQLLPSFHPCMCTGHWDTMQPHPLNGKTLILAPQSFAVSTSPQ